jgi:hypothetical protein
LPALHQNKTQLKAAHWRARSQEEQFSDHRVYFPVEKAKLQFSSDLKRSARKILGDFVPKLSEIFNKKILGLWKRWNSMRHWGLRDLLRSVHTI